MDVPPLRKGAVNVAPSFALLNFSTVMWTMLVFVNVANPVTTKSFFFLTTTQEASTAHNPDAAEDFGKPFGVQQDGI